MNSHGLVKECKSNNSYIVTINDCDKHISSDHMRLSAKDCSNNNTRVDNKLPLIKDSKKDSNDSSDDNIPLIMDYNNDSNNNDTFSDNDSILSDDSDIYMFPNIANNYQVMSNNNTNSMSKKHYRSELEKLNDGFIIFLPESRTRSGNRNR